MSKIVTLSMCGMTIDKKRIMEKPKRFYITQNDKYIVIMDRIAESTNKHNDLLHGNGVVAFFHKQENDKLAEETSKICAKLNELHDSNEFLLNEVNSKILKEIDEEEKDIAKRNNEMLSQIRCSQEDFADFLGCARVNGLMEIMAFPNGETTEDDNKFFSDICVDQWSTGDAGDSYGGFLYGKIADRKWLKVPYYC